MLTILVVDAELELVPKEMLDDYSIRIHAKKRKKPASKMLLDSNFMHSAINRYFPGESNRRGRPDIIFHLLQTAMESILNKRGQLRVIIHTRNDIIMNINSAVRLPKSYNRFVGVIESLFEKGFVGEEGSYLMQTEHGSWRDALAQTIGEPVLLSPRGISENVRDLFPECSRTDYTVIIGGFSQGDFISDVYSLGAGISIYKEELTIWSVAMEVICQYERDCGIL